ncbi:hypothetical protein OROGR_007700 [Orobanche gracilis]
MESLSSLGVGIPESSLDFSFGFGDATYSDRTLLLEISDDAESEPHAKVRRLPRDERHINATSLFKTIHINSLILAARSQFFRKLFSNGMLESGQKLVTLRIQTLEEVPIMDLLKYVYGNILPTTLHALLHLSVIADKFEVASCLRDCTQSLQNMPMTCEAASLYLNLPPSLLMSPTVEPLIDAAKQFLVARFKDIDQYDEEMLNLSLASIKMIISSDDLQVTSEGVVFDLVLTWARNQYSDLEERREIIKTHLIDLIRFPFMTVPQLIEKVQTCSDIDPELASHMVMRALCFKAETPHRKRCLATEEVNVVSRQFVERAYKSQAIKVKVVELESPHQHCIVFFHLTRKDLRGIFPDREIMSESFHLGKQEFVLVGRCYLCGVGEHKFCLVLKVMGSAEPPPVVKYEVAIRMKPSEEFNTWIGGNYAFSEEVSFPNLIDISWDCYMSDDNGYFINGVQYVRVELTIKK